LAGLNKCITECAAATTIFVKLFSVSCVYCSMKVCLFLLLASMLFAAARAGAAPSASDVEARLALLGVGQGSTKGAVLFFVGQDCPISNAMMPEANRIVEKYAPLGIVFYFVYPESDLTDQEAARHAKDFGMRAPVTVDREGRLVAKAGVKVTPEAAVFNASGRVVYHGRINDLYAGLEQRREVALTHDLRDALDAVVAGRLPPVPTIPAVGCFISTK
jgi:thiol-disulfide isomerase/thioredoxin